jgi:AcrR family transcriptional regulator
MAVPAQASLRERQKARRRNAILEAAAALFSEHGYQGTSMEAIAGRAEVGVATVYNYFGSKGALLAALQEPEFAALEQQALHLTQSPPQDPVTGIRRLIAIYRHFQNDWSNRQLLSAMIAPGLSAEPVLDELAERAELQLKRQLRELLAHYQAHGALRRDVPCADAAMVIFCVFNQHFIEYVTHEALPFEVMAAAMQRQIDLVVRGLS